MEQNLPFDLPQAPTDKRRIVFSFSTNDVEFFKCFPSDDFLGTRYDKNPAQLVVVWNIFLRPYNCEMQFYTPKNQLLVSVPVPKSINAPYTIIDGAINEWVTKEEYVNVQFVFTKDGQFVKSTVPIRMNLSPANKPEYLKLIKPTEFDRMKLLYDKAVTYTVLRFDDDNGWTYDFYAEDGTLRFSLPWVPSNVVQCVEQVFSPNEKMIARSNLRLPSTFIIPLSVSDGVSVTKDLKDYVNSVEDADWTVWKVSEDGTCSEVKALGKSYNGTKISFLLEEAIDGKIRVSCKSERYIPSEDSVLLESVYSGNAIMSENDELLYTNGRQKE